MQDGQGNTTSTQKISSQVDRRQGGEEPSKHHGHPTRKSKTTGHKKDNTTTFDPLLATKHCARFSRMAHGVFPSSLNSIDNADR